MVDWRTRNRLLEEAMRKHLAAVPRGTVLSTIELAEALLHYPVPLLADLDQRQVGSVLTKLAPWMSSLATHDGEEFIAYGRKNKRWRWHGQA